MENNLENAKKYLVETNIDFFSKSEQNVIGKTMVAYVNYLKSLEHKTIDGKILNNGDEFYSIISEPTMTSSGNYKVQPILLKYPEDWELSGNGAVAYFSKKECINECKKRNINKK